ncbi:MAG: ArdC family protein [Corallococcus sp.]|nr:ArdC family protein [Corallococcus sp.]
MNEGNNKLTPEREGLVNSILRNMQENNSIWIQGWTNVGAPISAITGKKYSGINRMYLSNAMAERGYKDNRWLTFKQMEDRGWTFKRDEEGKNLGKNAGVPIEYFELRDKETKKPFNIHILDGMTSEEKQEYVDNNVFPLRKYYRVFNAEVIDGIPQKEVKATGL